jgi:hypothetical protein
MQVSKPKNKDEVASPEEIVCNPPSFHPVKIYNSDGRYVKVWDPELKTYEVYCGDVNFAVPLYKNEKLNPPDLKSWTKVFVPDDQSSPGPFNGLWGYYKVLSKNDLN